MLFCHNYIFPSSVCFSSTIHSSKYTVYCCFGVSLKAGILYVNSTSGWKKVPFSADKGWKTYLFVRKSLEFESFKLLATLSALSSLDDMTLRIKCHFGRNEILMLIVWLVSFKRFPYLQVRLIPG